CKASGEECGVAEGIRYDPAAKEFSAEMAKLADIVRSLADKYGKDKVGVLVISFEEIAAIFAAAKAHPILSEVKWQGSDGTAGVAVLTKDPELAEFAIKVKFLNTIAAPGQSPFTEKVRKYVLEKLGREPEAYAYFAYDALWVIALALEAVDSYDPEAVKNIIPSILKHYLGASGYFTLDENGDRATGDYDLLIVRKVEGKYIWDKAGVFRAATGKVEWAPWWTGG
ncbi:MAG TPA: ABC transporter substrate-binding protein, partial [Acidilobales archaeon]|nr:ABC transporter substrate-binding protein [Acidilobales archaeon]